MPLELAILVGSALIAGSIFAFTFAVLRADREPDQEPDLSLARSNIALALATLAAAPVDPDLSPAEREQVDDARIAARSHLLELVTDEHEESFSFTGSLNPALAEILPQPELQYRLEFGGEDAPTTMDA